MTLSVAANAVVMHGLPAQQQQPVIAEKHHTVHLPTHRVQRPPHFGPGPVTLPPPKVASKAGLSSPSAHPPECISLTEQQSERILDIYRVERFHIEPTQTAVSGTEVKDVFCRKAALLPQVDVIFPHGIVSTPKASELYFRETVDHSEPVRVSYRGPFFL